MSVELHEEEPLGKVYDLRLLRRHWPVVARYRGQIGLTLGLVVPLYLLELAPAFFVGRRHDLAPTRRPR